MKKIIIVLMLMIVLVVAIPASSQGADLQVPDAALEAVLSGKSETSIYIVHMAEDPVIAYEGGVAGLPATRLERGQRLDPQSARVRDYVSYLTARHDTALRAVGASNRKVYDYHYSINAFAAELTAFEAQALAAQPGVVSVEPDSMRTLQTDNTPDFLGLNARGGAWDRGFVGEGVVVGVVDTGIWPEHPSFADTGYGPPPASFVGTGCDFGNTAFNPDDAPFGCNNKLLAAKSYSAGFLAFVGGPGGLAEGSYLSARDEDGHGTHTTSTAGGNFGVPASILGSDLGNISGIAPRARVSAYKACWTGEAVAGCAGSDLVAAIDAAVADGVDVINYSIGGGAGLLRGDSIAFLFAADAGVFVATSAGNTGPDPATVGGPGTAPWVTTVGANTQDRTFLGHAILGNGAEYAGVTLTGGTPELPLVDAEDAGDELCNPGALDPDVVAGKIVLCLRGVIARVAKSQAVEIAGGAGMILYNAADPDTLNTDNHYVPSLHVSNADGLAIKDYIAAEGASATARLTGGAAAPGQGSVMAAFSSRGPNVDSAHIIKPDVTAPGVNILAGNTPTALLGAPGQLFQAISGTSMSSPHVAGLAALVKQAHPDWSPAMIRSAMMTTARQDVTKEDGLTPADPFDMGAGHVNPGGFASRGPAGQPGLVYDADFFDYLGFLCDVAPEAFADPAATCGLLDLIGVPTEATNLNLPSIGVGALFGIQTITRTVTSVDSGTRIYRVSVDAPPGINVDVSPSELRLRGGQSASYSVTFTVTGGAAIEEWAFGSLTWIDRRQQYRVRSPIAVRPFLFGAPDEVSGSGTEGSLNFDVRFGYAGPYTAAPHGLVPAATEDDNVQDDPDDDINVALDCFFSTGFDPACGLTLHFVGVPAGSVYARFSLFDEFTDGNDDLDLYVFGPEPDLPFVGGSGSPTSEEQVDVPFPAPGTYWVFVHGWQTDGPDANYTLFNWVFGPDEGNMTVSGPSSVTLGSSHPVAVEWTGLTSGTRYLGAVSHNTPSGLADLTLVSINTE